MSSTRIFSSCSSNNRRFPSFCPNALIFLVKLAVTSAGFLFSTIFSNFFRAAPVAWTAFANLLRVAFIFLRCRTIRVSIKRTSYFAIRAVSKSPTFSINPETRLFPAPHLFFGPDVAPMKVFGLGNI